MNPRTRSRTPASIGSNQASPANGSMLPPGVVVLSCSMAWSPPALERRTGSLLRTGDYAARRFHHLHDGTGWKTRGDWSRANFPQAHAGAARIVVQRSLRRPARARRGLRPRSRVEALTTFESGDRGRRDLRCVGKLAHTHQKRGPHPALRSVQLVTL